MIDNFYAVSLLSLYDNEYHNGNAIERERRESRKFVSSVVIHCSAVPRLLAVRLRVSNACFSRDRLPAGSSHSTRTEIRGGKLILGARKLAAKHIA